MSALVASATVPTRGINAEPLRLDVDGAGRCCGEYMVCTDLLEEMRARLVAAQRVMNIDSPDEIRQNLRCHATVDDGHWNSPGASRSRGIRRSVASPAGCSTARHE